MLAKAAKNFFREVWTLFKLYELISREMITEIEANFRPWRRGVNSESNGVDDSPPDLNYFRGFKIKINCY